MSTIESLRTRIAVRRSLPSHARRRELRTLAGLTLREIAEAVGVDIATVSRWEHERDPRGEHLDRYVAVLRLLDEECETKGRGDDVQ
jgi:transcriptional regulator with XRE-family HTH domain